MAVSTRLESNKSHGREFSKSEEAEIDIAVWGCVKATNRVRVGSGNDPC